MARRKKKGKVVKYECMVCGKVQGKTNYYRLTKKIEYNARDNHYPICSECIKNKVYMNKDRTALDVVALQKLLQRLDLPFLINEWHGAVNAKNETVGTYFGSLGRKSSDDLYWERSQFDPDSPKENKKFIDEYALSNEISELMDDKNRVEILPGIFKYKDTLIAKYGDFKITDIIEFERKYIELRSSVDIENPVDTFNFINYVIYTVRLRRAMAKDNPDSNEIKKLQKFADDAEKSIKFIEHSDRSKALSMLMKKVELNHGEFDFIKEGFTERPLDEIDMALFIQDQLNKRNQGLDTSKYEYKDLYKSYRETQREKLDEELNKKIKSPEDLRV